MRRRGDYRSSDFDINSLPSTRKEMFKDVFKNHYFDLVKLCFIGFLFLIPFLAVGVIKDISYISSIKNEVNNNGFILLLSFIEIPCLLIFFIYLGGLGKIVKEYIWLEPVFFKDDFLKGIKENLKSCLLLGLIWSIFHIIFESCYIYFLNGFIVAIPFGFCYVVFLPIIIHSLLLNFVYTNPFKANFKLGIYLYYKHILTSLLLSLFIILLKLPSLFVFVNYQGMVFKYGVLILILILIAPFIVVAFYLNEMRIFDIRINSIKFPELINKGLHLKD